MIIFYIQNRLCCFFWPIDKSRSDTHFDIEALQHVSPAVTFLSFGGNVLELCRLSGSKILFVCIFIGIS